jgi:pheromone a factor receptor
MSVEIISEGHRFDIYEEVGCFPFVYTTWVSILTVSIPPLALSLASAVYAFLAIRAFYQTRAELKATLSVYSNLTASRYLRLIALCSCTIILMVPLSAYALHANITAGGLNPWISWNNTHFGYSRIDQYPSMLWRADPIVEVTTDVSRWLSVFCAFFFFVFFGFAEEARGYYLAIINSLAKRTGMKSMSLSYPSSISAFHNQRYAFSDIPVLFYCI